MSEFKNYHPTVNFIYYAVAVCFSMFFMNPVFLLISLVLGIVYLKISGGTKLWYILPMFLLTAIINPLVSHKGVTILCYFKSGNPLTLESVVYGIGAGIMLASVICHFANFNKTVTSDKVVYLFGKLTPSLSLVVSMVFRFVPEYKRRIREITNSIKCIGTDVEKGKTVNRIKTAIKILSVMTTISLENGIETADSMKSRGFGVNKRTHYANYSFDKRDGKALIFIAVLTSYIIFGKCFGAVDFTYYPMLKISKITTFSITVYFAYFLLLATPVIIEIREEIKWKKLKSKI